MEFLNPFALILLLFIPFILLIKHKYPFSKDVIKKITFFAKFNSKKRLYFLLAAFIFAILALSRPVINNGKTKILAPTSTIGIILDLSKDALKSDLYPNRFKIYVIKLKELFSHLKGENIVIIGASIRPSLIVPPTNDYNSIIYLLNHISNQVFNKSNFNLAKKAIIQFNPQTVILLKGKSFYINDKKIEITYSNEDISKVLSQIKTKKEKITIYNKKELFYYPLLVSIILFIIGGL